MDYTGIPGYNDRKPQDSPGALCSYGPGNMWANANTVVLAGDADAYVYPHQNAYTSFGSASSYNSPTASFDAYTPLTAASPEQSAVEQIPFGIGGHVDVEGASMMYKSLSGMESFSQPGWNGSLRNGLQSGGGNRALAPVLRPTSGTAQGDRSTMTISDSNHDHVQHSREQCLRSRWMQGQWADQDAIHACSMNAFSQLKPFHDAAAHDGRPWLAAHHHNPMQHLSIANSCVAVNPLQRAEYPVPWVQSWHLRQQGLSPEYQVQPTTRDPHAIVPCSHAPLAFEYESTSGLSDSETDEVPSPKRAPNSQKILSGRKGKARALSARKSKDEFLVRSKLDGMSYKEIRAEGKFAETESTLRGRFRTLTKKKHERLRRPEWRDRDVKLLARAVKACSSLSLDAGCGKKLSRNRKETGSEDTMKGKTPWKTVAQWIVDHGGSYHFGAGTCKKKWESVEEK